MEFQASKSSSSRVAQNTPDLKQDERRRWYDIDDLNNLIDRDFGPPETCPRWPRSYAYKWHDMVWAIAPKPIVLAKATNAEEFRAEMQSITIDSLTYTRKMPEKYRADLAEKCQEFYLAAQDKENHVAKLDAVLTEMLFCKYHPREISREDLGRKIDSSLCRQPPTVLPLPDFTSSKPDELYFHGKNHGWDDQGWCPACNKILSGTSPARS